MVYLLGMGCYVGRVKVWHALLMTALILGCVRPAWFKWALLTALALFFGISG
jgi:hypothetical protein